MAEQQGIIVHDYANFVKSFRDMEKAEAKRQRERLRSVGAIVKTAATALMAPIDARSAAGYRVLVRQRGVAVGQALKKTTGLRADFGVLQMRRALLPALDRNQEELNRQLTEMLDQIAREEGF